MQRLDRKRKPVCTALLQVITAILFLSPAAAADSSIKADKTEEGLRIDNGTISLLVNDHFQLVPSLKNDDNLLTLVRPDANRKSAFGIVLEGTSFDHFRVDWDNFREEKMPAGEPEGSKFLLRGGCMRALEESAETVTIELELGLTFYDKFPSALLCSARFTNPGEKKLSIDKLLSTSLRLDRSLVEEGEKPYAFASYHGSQLPWGQDYSLVRVTRDFERENFMGVRVNRDSVCIGGGTPLIDLWTSVCGLALATAEPSPQWVSLPVRTAEDALVEVAVSQSPEKRLGQKNILEPGGSVNTVNTALILHRLDFFEPVRTFSRLLRSQGVNIKKTSPREAFEPYWKSWGFGHDFTLEKIYSCLPVLKEAGIKWANLDAGWFIHHGDSEPDPAPGKFPGGTGDMQSFVDSLHRAGFKSSLWWYPQAVSPQSELALSRPDLLVRNQDGTFPRSINKTCYLCPVHQGSIDYIKKRVRKIMGEWGFDGLYLDLQGLSTTPPCFNPEHKHNSPLDSYQYQAEFFRAIYNTAQEIKPGCPVEMCICAMPHDPYKMPYYNVANSSDPVNLKQMRRRVKLEKAFRETGFCVGDCYQIPMDEWEGYSVPESFESALGTGAQVTTFFRDLSPEQAVKWKRWVALYRELGLAWSEYLNLYDTAFDSPEAHVMRKGDKLYYAFYADHWSLRKKIEFRGLEQGREYRITDWTSGSVLGTVSAEKPYINRSFKEHLLLELSPVEQK
jgi:alpha-galactosidase